MPPLPPRPSLALRTYTLGDDVTDAEVGAALHNGVMLLQRAFRNGQLQVHDDALFTNSYGGALNVPGLDALCVYALLHAGKALSEPWLAADAPFTQQMLSVLKSYRLTLTYHRSLRAAALAVYNRPEDFPALEDDTHWLVRTCIDGAYSYGKFDLPDPRQQASQPPQGSRITTGPNHDLEIYPGWDNSNSQYGLLGVWAGADAGVAVPVSYWQQVQQHWVDCQELNGEWGYLNGDRPRLSMTDAGVASLLVSSDYLSDSRGGVPTAQDAVERALSFLDQDDNAITGIGASGWSGYALYGLERVGLASGYKFFGKHDWYEEFAKQLVHTQRPDGSWGPSPANSQTAMDTAYSLLFLARGRHPVFYNKLRFPGAWNAYPRDVANLTRFASYELQRPLNWQVIDTASDWPSWMDCPVLYLSSEARPKLTPADLDQLRHFALAGGVIFTQPDGVGSAFNAWVAQTVGRLFPQYALRPVPANHPIFSSLYTIKPPAGDLLGVSNGSRLLWVHSPKDMARDWARDWTDAGRAHYQVGLNLFVYANGKTQLHNRLESPYIPPPPVAPTGQIPVVRLSYAGNWDPEPYAWTRFRNYFQWEAQEDVKVTDGDLGSLLPGQAPLAVLTGTASVTFDQKQVNAVRAYVQAGGVLLIDACGGSADFAISVKQSLLDKAFPSASLQEVGRTHPLVVAGGFGAEDLSNPVYRPYARDLARGGTPPVLQFLSAGGGQVVLSRLDLTTGLLGTTMFGINGYDPLYAAALVKNAVLWADARSAPPNSQPAP